MKIRSVEAEHFTIPLPVVLTDSTHGEMRFFDLVTCRIRTDSAETGLGYTYTVGAGGSAIRELIARDLAPLLLGADSRRIERIWEAMWWRLHYVGRAGLASFAISAVDIALWDLKARCAGEPLWRFLGGYSDRAFAYAGGIDLHLSTGDLVAQAKDLLAHGFRAIKMKVGREDLAEDVERLARVREAVGPSVALMVDANMCWRVEQAIRASRALAPYGVYWLEEPTIPEDIEGYVRIAREAPLPITAGENLRSVHEFQQLIGSGALSFAEPDVSNVGGITTWLKVAHLAQARNVPVTSHGIHDLHVHLLAAIPNASFLEVHGFDLERFLLHELVLQEGHVLAPHRPGHGVEFDWAALERHRAVDIAAAVTDERL